MAYALGSIEDREHKQLGRSTPFDALADLKDYLRGEFRHHRPLKVTRDQATACGLALDERMVSSLEVLSAISRFPRHVRSLLELLYVEGYQIKDAAALIGVSERHARRLRDIALRAMVGWIYD